MGERERGRPPPSGSRPEITPSSDDFGQPARHQPPGLERQPRHQPGKLRGVCCTEHTTICAYFNDCTLFVCSSFFFDEYSLARGLLQSAKAGDDLHLGTFLASYQLGTPADQSGSDVDAHDSLAFVEQPAIDDELDSQPTANHEPGRQLPPTIGADNDRAFEYPFKGSNVSAEEWHQANSAANARVEESVEHLRTQAFKDTNAMPQREAKPTPSLPTTDWRPSEPADLFKQCTLRPSTNGPFIERLCKRLDVDELVLSKHDVWNLIRTWLTLADLDFLSCLPKEDGGRGKFRSHRISALLFFIDAKDCMCDEALPFIWDLRDYAANPNAEIHPIRRGDERREKLHTAGIAVLQSLAGSPDEQIIHEMACGVNTQTASAMRCIILMPNSKEHFRNASIAFKKMKAEVDSGVLVPFFGAIPCWMPLGVYTEGFTPTTDAMREHGKLPRRTGHGPAPGYSALKRYTDPLSYETDSQGFLVVDNGELRDIALNEEINLDDEVAFPAYELPSVQTHARNIAIMSTLGEETRDPRHEINQLYTDWSAYYRSLVQLIEFMWRTCIHGITLFNDTAYYFGDRGAAAKSQRVMSVLVCYTLMIFLLLLDKCTSYDVVRRRECPPGQSGMYFHAGYASLHERSEMLIAQVTDSIDTSSALNWDASPASRKWRQDRYDAAVRQGLSKHQCVFASIPCTMQGYIDDGQISLAACFVPLFIAALLRMVAMTGIQLAASKLQWAQPGKLYKANLLREPPMLPEDIDWVRDMVHDNAVCLGRYMDTRNGKIHDTPERIADVSKRTRQLVEQAATTNGKVSFLLFRALLGVLIWMVAIAPVMRSCLNACWKCLYAKTRLRTAAKQVSHRREEDHLVPFPADIEKDMLNLIAFLSNHDGYLFAPTTQQPNDPIFIMNDSAGQSSVVGQENDWRGGGVWLYVPGATHTMYSVYRWSKWVLTGANGGNGLTSTTTEMINANMSLAAVINAFPDRDLVEVLDSSSAVACLRRLACHSEELQGPLRYRAELLQHLSADARIWTVWSAREFGTLADLLSKLQLVAFTEGLVARGLPPPASSPFERAEPRL